MVYPKSNFYSQEVFGFNHILRIGRTMVLVYLKMEIGPPYEIRMVYLKFDKWSPVCLIKYVWLNIFQHFGPRYELIHTYGLFGTEE